MHIKLQAQKHNWLEHPTAATRLLRQRLEPPPARYRLCLTSGLVWFDWQSDKARIVFHQSRIRRHIYTAALRAVWTGQGAGRD